MIEGLRWAELTQDDPWPQRQRLRGARARGMTYQRHLARELRRRFGPENLHESQWLRFIDANGRGYAQPDVYLVGSRSVVCFEAKLTQRDAALAQLGRLYRPLLRHVYGKPVVGVVVCKNLVYRPGRWQIPGPEEVLDTTQEAIYTWHWLGR